MYKMRRAAALFIASILIGGCGDDRKDNSEGQPAEEETDTSQIEDSETDTQSAEDTATQDQARSLYDFDAAAPWYECPQDEFPEEVTVVNAMQQEYHFITFGNEEKEGVDARNLWADVEFPPSGDWAQVGLKVMLECPETGLCDHWDRYGSVQLVLNPDDPQKSWKYLELARHITPYRIEMCQYIDVTPLASLLVGKQKIHSFIDTWVGPQHSNGEGWRITVNFVFYPGDKNQADEVINIWGKRHVALGNTDPEANVDFQIEPVTVAIPSDAKKVEVHAITTGHGFGFTNNCAEFCPLRQDVVVNGNVHSFLPWREDCENNPVSPQWGTWEYNRNGWCPGAIAVGNILDITNSLTLGEDNTIDFDIRTRKGEEYVDESGAEGDPYEVMSLKLYVYR